MVRSLAVVVESADDEVHNKVTPKDVEDEDDHSGEADVDGDDDDDDFESSKRANIITKPGEHDVLLGRGGGTNNHCGNIKFRKLVNEHKMRYLACSKVEKPKVARDVVILWRKLEPPGRFLTRKDESKRGGGTGAGKVDDNIWMEVGDKKAREKASQCLRERTPDVIPYIKHLRDQQNAITEHGVSIIQQQIQMQEQAMQLGVPFQPVFPAVATSSNVPPFPRRNTQVPVPQPQAIPPATQAVISNSLSNPEGIAQASRAIQHEQSTLLRPDTRRVSHPIVPQHQFSLAQQLQLQQQQQEQICAGIMYDGYPPEDEFVFSGEITNAEYQRNLLMQRQLQLRQLQMQRLMHQQQLRRLQQQQLQQPGSQLGMGPMLGMNSERGFSMRQPNQMRSGVTLDMNGNQMMGSFSEPRIPRMNTGLFVINPTLNRLSMTNYDLVSQNMAGGDQETADAAILLGKLPQAQQIQSPNNTIRNKNNTQVEHSRLKRKLGHPPQQTSVVPDKAPSTNKDNLVDLQPADINSDNNDFTLEEYRHQLEEYITNSNSSNYNIQQSPLVVDKTTSHLKVDDDASDLEDDWEKEKEKSNRSGKVSHGDRKRRVNRNVSGVSAVSKGSAMGMSLVSGMSELSDMMSATSDNLVERENGTKRQSSSLSIMSELTDLSQHVDNLSLCDDDL